jgi:hemin uptake protein HemP
MTRPEHVQTQSAVRLTLVASDPPNSGAQTVISSQELFRYGSELLIEHFGQLYRLRMTRENKLILTK